MRPQLLKVSKAPAHSFSVRQDVVPVNNRWHYHPEVELIYIKKGTGTQFVGDNIKHFGGGDIILIGAHLPHYLRFDDLCYETAGTAADVRVVHFRENFWGDEFLNLPENGIIKTLLEKARRGIQVTGKNKNKVAGLLELMLRSEGPRRIMFLMETLTAIAACNQSPLLSSMGFRHDFEEAENDRVNAIYEYSLANFKKKIQLREIAGIANISPNSFCRYFKSRTRKTYSQFLTGLRVGHACKLLIENKLSVKQICFESGFHNFASFHKYFKLITGKSPLNYQKEFLNSGNSAT